jgi:hypothetical protein
VRVEARDAQRMHVLAEGVAQTIRNATATV